MGQSIDWLGLVGWLTTIADVEDGEFVYLELLVTTRLIRAEGGGRRQRLIGLGQLKCGLKRLV